MTCDQVIKTLEDLAHGSLTKLWNKVPAQNGLPLPGTMLRLPIEYGEWAGTAGLAQRPGSSRRSSWTDL